MTDQTNDPTAEVQPIADLSGMPKPTRLTVRIRKNLPYQLARFVVLNGRMVRMVLAGHGDSAGKKPESGER